MGAHNKVRLHLPVGERYMELHDHEGNVLMELWDHATRRDIEAGLIDLETSGLTKAIHALYREQHA